MDMSSVAKAVSLLVVVVLRLHVDILRFVSKMCSHRSRLKSQCSSRLRLFDCVTGAQLGNFVALPVTGLLCQYGFDGGWASSFYILGKQKCVCVYNIIWR